MSIKSTFKRLYDSRRTITIKVDDPNGEYRTYTYKKKSGDNFTNDTYIAKEKAGHLKAGQHVSESEPFRMDAIRETCIVGTALALSCTFWEMWVKCYPIWEWPKGKVKDGYALTLLSPFVLVYWAIFTPFYISGIVLTGLFVGFSAIWTFVFECPAGYLNDERSYIGGGTGATEWNTDNTPSTATNK